MQNNCVIIWTTLADKFSKSIICCVIAQIYTKAVPNVYESVKSVQNVYESVKIVQNVYKSVKFVQNVYESVKIAQNVYESVKIEIVQDAVGLVDWRDGAAEGRLRACEQESAPFSILVLFSLVLALLHLVVVLLILVFEVFPHRNLSLSLWSLLAMDR